jgi:primosomal protein N' (replication factor Y)
VAETIASPDAVYLLQGVTKWQDRSLSSSIGTGVITRKTVLMIVPEIALTPMMVAYFLSRFAGQVAILHSELTRPKNMTSTDASPEARPKS